MVGSFIFNGVNSESFNLVCKSVKRPLLPASKNNRVDILGASGSYEFNNDQYSVSTITMRLQYVGLSYVELRTRARQLAAWLSTNTWSTLIINDESDKYYLAKVNSEIDLENLWESGSANITFDCQPFAYSVIEKIYGFSTSGSTTYNFMNDGTRYIDFRSPQGSKSRIKINGSWSNITLSMNGKTLSFIEAGSGELIFDNANMTVTVNGVNKFNKASGNLETFLKIIPGTNSLVVSGSGLSVSISIEFIPMWM